MVKKFLKHIKKGIYNYWGEFMNLIGVIKRKEDNYLNNYIDALKKLKANVIIIENFIDELNIFKKVKICSGILFTGGTSWELVDEKILKYCLDNNVPFLGICLGMQMIGNYFSKDHVLGMDKTVKIEDNKHYSNSKYTHDVILKNGILSDLFNTNKILVNSYHNYCVHDTQDKIIKGYCSDGVIEALEIPNLIFGVGVQWHPEKMIDYDENSRKLIGKFIDSAKEYGYKKSKKTR